MSFVDPKTYGQIVKCTDGYGNMSLSINVWDCKAKEYRRVYLYEKGCVSDSKYYDKGAGFIYNGGTETPNIGYGSYQYRDTGLHIQTLGELLVEKLK